MAAPARENPARHAALPLRRRLGVRILAVMVLAIVVIELIILVPMTLHFRRERREHFYALAAAAAGRAAPALAASLTRSQPAPNEIAALVPEAGTTTALYDRNRRVVWAAPGWPLRPMARVVAGKPSLDGVLEGDFEGGCYVLFPLRDMEGRDAGLLAIVEGSDRLLAETVAYVARVLGIVLLICLFTAVVVFGYIRRAVLRPIEAIVRANIASAGEPSAAEIVPEAIAPDTELGEIIRTRNRMLESLRAAREEILRQNEQLERWNRTLERRVEERTRELHAVRERAVQAEKLAEIGQLAASVAHEVNNPLGIIGASAEDLRRQLAALPERDRERDRPFEIIRSQIDRCRRIVDALLSFSRRASSRPQPIALAPFLAHTAELVQRRADSERKRIAVEPGGPPLSVVAMPTQLQQALVNLLENALDATPDGGTVVLGARAGEAGAEIFVRDEGPGMPEEIRRQIFEPFFTTKEPGRGAGMGLTIAAQFVRAQGGRLVCDSREGAGSTFRILLPLAPEGQFP